MAHFTLVLLLAACSALNANAFVPIPSFRVSKLNSVAMPTTSLFMSDDFLQQSPEATREHIEDLIDSHPVLLFMKGTQLFPQCGFSNTAVQILNTFNLDFHSVDVLADDAIRQGIKDYSQWPTIPQLYVAGEFIGGCDMYVKSDCWLFLFACLEI
jgi:monothiol glutaredoxin